MEFLKKHLVHVVAIIVFFASTFIYFGPAFQGKKLQQSDTLQWKGMAQEIQEYHDKTGEYPLWTNSMFGGMPSYYINFKQASGPIDWLRKALSLGFKGEIGKFLTGMILFYLLMILLKVHPVLSIFAALAFAFGTNNLVLLHAGHNTKVATLMTSPLIIAGVITAYNKRALLGAILFALGMSINLKSQHPQMTYYLGMVMGIYVLAVLIEKIRSGELPDFIKASGWLLLGLVIALGTTAGKTLPIYEYSKDTMRGSPILKESKSNDSSSKVDGLSWEYAMQWSNGSEDLLQSFIPLSVGGSSSEPLDKDSEFAKFLRSKNYPTRGQKSPMYWGSLPFTSGPIYFGSIVFLLFVISLFTLKGPIKWWVASAVLLTFLLSMGKNLEWFNKLFFDVFPYYNKFRTPNSILSVTAVIIPLMAMVGLSRMTEKINMKLVLVTGGVFTLLTAAIGLLGPGVFDFSSVSDASLAEQGGLNVRILEEDRASLLKSSALRSAFFMLLAMAAIWAFSKKYIPQVAMFSIIGVLSFVDFYQINQRYVSSDDYLTERRLDGYFTPRAVDTKILSDTDPHYRVLDVTQNPAASSFASYFHKSLGGYHAAKLQRYQDILDNHILANNNKVINMLNTKYVIQGQRGSESHSLNPAALGNAWFVNGVRYVDTPDQEIGALNDFDPLGEAIVHKEFQGMLNKTSFAKEGSSIRLTSYKPDELTYQVNASGDQLAVFSEVWYGPNKGWNAYIDGKKVSHLRANYILRALPIPSGQHEVRFEFRPRSNQIGKLIGLISTLVLLLMIAYYGWGVYKDSKA